MSTPKTPAVATATIDMTQFTNAGHNVKMRVVDNILFVAIPIDDKTVAASRPSMSGKSRTIGSTLGNVTVPGTAIKLGVNVYAPLAAAAAA